jgi:hypothetical protein
MKRVLLRGLAGSGLLLFSLAASAQTIPQQTNPQQIQNPFYSQDEYQNTHSMFDKIRNDLYRAQTDAYPNYLGDGARFDIVHNQLRTLEGNWDKGVYDSHELDNTISAVQMVLNDNRLTGHDRDVLSADLSRLLEFRTEYYG